MSKTPKAPSPAPSRAACCGSTSTARWRRHFLVPGLPRFLAEYPDLQLHIGEGDRLVDLVEEGVDCVLRAGEPRDSAMVGRRIAMLDEVTCASPDYLARFGVPRTVDDLAGHRMIGFISSVTKTVIPLEFTVDGALRHVTLPMTVSVSAGETSHASGEARSRASCRCRAITSSRISRPARLVEVLPAVSAVADAGVAALSAQPSAIAARARVHRLDSQGIRRKDAIRTGLIFRAMGCSPRRGDYIDTDD